MMRPPASALYFPSIEFHDEDFLRRSLLYWDSIARIVPADFVPNDSDFVKELVDAGMVRNITVKSSTLELVANRFINRIKSPNRAAGLSLTSYESGVEDKILTGLHSSKIHYVLRDLLREVGYIPQVPDQYGFYNVQNELAGYYMLVLAIEEAKWRRLPLATDVPEIWSITPSFIEKNNISEMGSDSDGINCLTSMTIDGIMPSNVKGLEAGDIIKLAKDSKDARKCLREHIGSVIDRIQIIDCQEQAYDELGELMNEIERDKAEYRMSQRFWNSEELSSCLNVAIPTMATLYSLNTGDPIIAVGAIAFTFIQYIRNCQLLKKNRNASYQAYLVGLDKKTSSWLPSQTATRLNEFIYD